MHRAVRKATFRRGRSATDRIYNLSWGYYVIASSHQDHHDNWKKICKGDWYGGSEDAEHKVATTAAPDHKIIFFSSFGPILQPDPWAVEDVTTGRHAEDTLPSSIEWQSRTGRRTASIRTTAWRR